MQRRRCCFSLTEALITSFFFIHCAPDIFFSYDGTLFQESGVGHVWMWPVQQEQLSAIRASVVGILAWGRFPVVSSGLYCQCVSLLALSLQLFEVPVVDWVTETYSWAGNSAAWKNRILCRVLISTHSFVQATKALNYIYKYVSNELKIATSITLSGSGFMAPVTLTEHTTL